MNYTSYLRPNQIRSYPHNFLKKSKGDGVEGGGYLSKISENITSGNGTGPLATFNPHCCSSTITRTDDV